MKVLPFLFLACIAFAGCSKDNPGNNTPITPPRPDTLTTGWSKVILPATAKSAWDIVFINNSTGYLLGTGGLYKSSDGGNTWNLVNTTFAHGAFLTATASGVFALGGRDSVFASFDGGISASGIQLNSPSFVTDIYFANNDTGYIPGGPNSLYRTTDGGHTWAKLNPVSGLDLGVDKSYLPFFINGNTGWISDGDGKIFHTNGSANSWSPAGGIPVGTRGFITLFAVNSNIVYAGMAVNNTPVFKSTDGGANFSPTGSVPGFAPSYPDLYFTSADTGWLCEAKKIFSTTDGGATWTTVVSLGEATPIEIHFTDSDHGWACCTDGSVLLFKR